MFSYCDFEKNERMKLYMADFSSENVERAQEMLVGDKRFHSVSSSAFDYSTNVLFYFWNPKNQITKPLVE
jgi:hypothetical protein